MVRKINTGYVYLIGNKEIAPCGKIYKKNRGTEKFSYELSETNDYDTRYCLLNYCYIIVRT